MRPYLEAIPPRGNSPLGASPPAFTIQHSAYTRFSASPMAISTPVSAKASEALYALKPVSFRYNKQYDTTQTIAFGLIAEKVAEVYPDLVGRDRKGQPESVRYEQIKAMLLNEFLKEHKKVEEQQATIGELKSTVAQQQKGMEILTARLKEQAAQIQKVSAHLEVSKRAPQVVVNK